MAGGYCVRGHGGRTFLSLQKFASASAALDLSLKVSSSWKKPFLAQYPLHMEPYFNSQCSHIILYFIELHVVYELFIFLFISNNKIVIKSNRITK